MSMASFSVRRPIFISMASCIVLLLGMVSLFNLPVDLMPDITYPTISISTTYEDASPEEMEELISKPIEKAVSAVTGVDTISSSSSEGISTINISFVWGTNLDAAAADIRDRLDRVVGSLPEDAEKPVVRKFDVSGFPILTIGVGTDISLLDARNIIEDQVQYRIERLPGVASCDINGGLIREIQVQFDVDKVKALDIPLNRVLDTIKAGNVTTPAGNVEEGRLDIRVRTPGTFSSPEQLRNIVIGYRDGSMIRLRDVAEVVDTTQKVSRYIRINGKPGMYLGIMKQSGANTVQVANAVLAEFEKLNHEMPHIKFTAVMNTAKYIKAAIANVTESAYTGGLLAVLVLLFFLRNIFSTLIISVSIPLSVVASFALIYFCGFTLNIMTLGGLALGIGMLVDNSIVVLENINRLHDEGMSARDAAIKGAGDVTAAIFASTLTTLVVFLPLMFVKGVAGVMFREFSMVVTFSLTCSIFTAVMLVPMLSSQLLGRNRTTAHPGMCRRLLRRFYDWSSEIFARMDNAYAELLHSVLKHPWRIIIGSALLLAGSLALIPLLGTEFMPKTDEGEVRIEVEGEVGTRSDVIDTVIRDIERTLKNEVPEMTYTNARAGSSNFHANGNHRGQIRIDLVPRAQRKRSSEEIAAALQKRYAGIPGVTIRCRSGQGLFLLRMASGSNSGEQIAIEIRGNDFATADYLARQFKAMAEKVRGVTDVRLSRDSGTPEERLIIDRHKADDLKVSVDDIAGAMRTVLAGSSAGEYRELGKEYNILVKVKDADKMNLDRLLDIAIRNQDGQKVILRNLVRYERNVGPVTIDRKDQQRVVTVFVNIVDRDMGSVITDIRTELDKIPLPPNFSVVFSGDYEEQQKSFRQLMASLVLALILVYMVMACQFESLRDPFTVMFATPLAAIGVLIMLFITNTTFNVQSFIGCIMLAGIVVNNAILLVDCAQRLRAEGMNIRPAIEEAGRQRLRPILMTTMTTILGLLPLALGLGDGGEAQAPLARAVIGGLTSSTAITLLFVPAAYLLLETFMHHRKARQNDNSVA